MELVSLLKREGGSERESLLNGRGGGREGGREGETERESE